MGSLILHRLRFDDMGRQAGGRVGLHRQFRPAGAILPHEPDALHHAYFGPYVSGPIAMLAHADTDISRFMDSLQWVDQTYYAKHKSENPKTLRAEYYTELRMYSAHGDTSKHRKPIDAALAFLIRFGRRAGISLAIYTLSYLPIVGRFVLPAATFYTFKNAVGPTPATVIFGSGIFLPRRYLIVFLQSYFSSRSLMRELVLCPGSPSVLPRKHG